MLKIIAAVLLIVCLCPMAYGHGMSEEDKIRAAEGGFFDFFPLGAIHMLTGYDHLLFLFGVVFFLTKFMDILKFVTAFTVGHSITLIGATFMGIQANYFLVDAVIALTVCYKGFDNVDGFRKFLNMKSPNLLGAVFIFGLIHGFGLSTRLQQVTIGEGMDLLGKIIAFNIGVEAGQVAALAVIITVLSAWRHTESFARFSMASNVGLIIVGGLLFNMQLHGYQHSADPAAFGFDEDSHAHVHEDWGTGSGGLPPGWHFDEGSNVPHTHDDEGDDHSHDEAAPHTHGGEGHSHDEAAPHTHGDGGHSHEATVPHVHDDEAHGHTHDETAPHTHDEGEEHSHDDTATHSHGHDSGHSHDEGHDHTHSHDGDSHAHEAGGDAEFDNPQKPFERPPNFQ